MSVICELLRSERIKKGLGPNDVEEGTGIRVLYVMAIEEGRFDALPGEVYTKGFIRNYANYLGLDGAKMVRMYTEESTGRSDDAAPNPSTEPANKQATSSLSNTVWVIVFLVLATTVGIGFYWWMSGSGPLKGGVASIKPSNAPVVSSTTPASTTAQPAVQPVIPPSKPVFSRPAVLTARYTQRCWTSVTADGRVVFEGVPSAGDTLTWEADRQIFVNFGNAAAVELTFNGNPVGKIGEQGEVVNRSFQAPTSPPRT